METKKQVKIGDISSETSKKICDYMNGAHEITLYAMAKASLTNSADKRKELSNSSMNSISLESCDISFTLSNNEESEEKHVKFPFDPPLQSSKELKKRITEIHDKIFSPNASWLLTDPMALGLLLLAITLAYSTHILKHDGIILSVYKMHPFLQNMIDSIFSSRSSFASFVIYLWYVYVGAHVVESLMLVSVCQKYLQLRNGILLQWFVLGVAVSYPISRRILHFVDMQKQIISNEDKKDM